MITVVRYLSVFYQLSMSGQGWVNASLLLSVGDKTHRCGLGFCSLAGRLSPSLPLSRPWCDQYGGAAQSASTHKCSPSPTHLPAGQVESPVKSRSDIFAHLVMHCTMCSLYNLSSFQLNKLRHILKFTS